MAKNMKCYLCSSDVEVKSFKEHAKIFDCFKCGQYRLTNELCLFFEENGVDIVKLKRMRQEYPYVTVMGLYSYKINF